MDSRESVVSGLRRRAGDSLSRSDFADLEDTCQRILQVLPYDADACFLLGMASAGLGRLNRAIAFIRQAIQAAPDRADYRAQLARCLSQVQQNEAALHAVSGALALNPDDALTLDTLGVVLARVGHHGQATELFRRAVAKTPRNAGFQYNLAVSLRFMGEFEEAEAALEKAVESTPRDYRVHLALAEARRQTADNNHIARLTDLLVGVGADVDGELRLRHALAKEHEDLGEYAAAFQHLAVGRSKKRKALGYRFASDAAVFKTIERVCNQEFCRSESGPSSPGPVPIFVVGMPRTGTTLVERILSSHSQVTSAGELQAFPICLKQSAGTRSSSVLDSATFEAAESLDFEEIGARYLDRTKLAAGSTRYFVDKMPLNFLNAGFIHRALPDARIICLQRNPLDTCISNFRQLFAVNFPYYHYAYSLDDIADYYIAFRHLLDHWDRVLPGVILRVEYERLVADPEGEIRRLLLHCGLSAEQACLEPHVNPAPVATASAVQVREPLNCKPIGRWRHYAVALGPIRQRLEAAGIGSTAPEGVGIHKPPQT